MQRRSGIYVNELVNTVQSGCQDEIVNTSSRRLPRAHRRCCSRRTPPVGYFSSGRRTRRRRGLWDRGGIARAWGIAGFCPVSRRKATCFWNPWSTAEDSPPGIHGPRKPSLKVFFFYWYLVHYALCLLCGPTCNKIVSLRYVSFRESLDNVKKKIRYYFHRWM